MRHLLFCTCVLLLPGVLSAQPDTKREVDLVIRDAQIFDGEVAREGYLVVDQGMIVAITDELHEFLPRKTVHADGKTVLPTFGNAHTHSWFPAHLKEANDHGISRIFDMHGTDHGAAMLRGLRDSLGYAEYYSTGSGATVPEGHGTQYGIPVPIIDHQTSAAQFTKDRAQAGADYIKILREPSRPTLSYLQCDTVINTAHALDLVAVAHVTVADDAVRLAEGGVDGFVHIWYDRTMTEEELGTVAANDVFMVPTLIVIRGAIDVWKEQGGRKLVPFEQVLQETFRAYAGGVRLLAGTDAPNFNITHGKDLHEEVILLASSGIPEIDALRAATSNIADAFKMDDFGRLRPGARADFFIVEGDPLSNIEDLRNDKQVWRRGVLVVE